MPSYTVTARATLALTYRGRTVSIHGEIGGIFGKVIANAASREEAIENTLFVMRQKCNVMDGWGRHEVRLKEIE